MRQESVMIPIGEQTEKKEYALIPLYSKFSFSFPPFFVQEKEIEYEVQRLVSFENWPEEKTDIKEVVRAVESIKTIAQQLDEYLMAQGNISWHLEHVFWNRFQKEVQVLFVPDGSGGTMENFWRAWVENLLKRILLQQWQEETKILWIVRLCQRIMVGQEERWLEEVAQEQEIQFVQEKEENISLENEEQKDKRKKRFLSLPRSRKYDMIPMD